MPLLASPDAASSLCSVVRDGNLKRRALTLTDVGFWHDIGAATALLGALQTLPRLRHLYLSQNALQPEHAAAAGAALGALVAHSATLISLSVSDCQLGDAGLGPIFDALPQSCCIYTLLCSDSGMSDVFARERLLPAVRACASLQTLSADDCPAVREAQELLQQRW